MHFFVPPYTEARIKDQYRALAKQFHPDKAGNELQMKKVNEEKELLLKLIAIEPARSNGKKKFAKPIRLMNKRRPGRVVVVMPDAKQIISIIKELRKL